MTTETGAARTPYEHPWTGAPDGVAANFAVADLINNLPRHLAATNARVPPETLLAAAGAIAGFAAQRALMHRMTPEQVIDPASGFSIVQTTRGGLFFFGEPLDRALLPQSPDDRDKLWPLAASGAIEAGLDPNGLPPLEPMFEHVAKTLGSPREGTTSFPDCRFQTPTFELLKSVWPLALMCFNGQLSAQVLNPAVIVSQRWRPVIAAIAANRMIRDVAQTVPPKKALTIVMETAIYASKLAPAAVESQAAPAFSA